ncbi:MAG TPA: AAA family ATPase [Lentisphaeria bacterium]|nr:AAA family ATPase [Lentisphaeria bacterium]
MNRQFTEILAKRLKDRRNFIQIVSGPRQVGKTTGAMQVSKALDIPCHFASADEPLLKNSVWLDEQWEIARTKCTTSKSHLGEAVLFIDEVQKIQDWAERVKFLWDRDTSQNKPLKVVLLGSAKLAVHKGLTESLAGRFEVIPVTHWSYGEMKTAFGWNLEKFIYFGGYPSSAKLVDDEVRWRRYVRDSLIETTVSRDLILLSPVLKPSLFRRLMQLACEYSGEILSYQKMTGQLKDAGNTTTLAHYLDLLDAAGLVRGLHKYSGQNLRVRASSPKLQVYNNALKSALMDTDFNSIHGDASRWGRFVESAAGAHLLNSAVQDDIPVYYWRSGDAEVDFVVKHKGKLIGFEIKSGGRTGSSDGFCSFLKHYPDAHPLVVGTGGINLEEFFLTSISEWF